MALTGPIMYLEKEECHITTSATNIVSKLNLEASLRNARRKEVFSNVAQFCKENKDTCVCMFQHSFQDLIFPNSTTYGINSRRLDIFLVGRRTLHVEMILTKDTVTFARVSKSI